MKKQKNKKTKNKINKETKQLIGIMTVIIIIFSAVLIPYFYIQSQKVFDYVGVTWQKEQYGELTVYHTKFPKIYDGKDYGIHNVYLRNNPKKNSIPLEIENLTFRENVIVTQSKEILNCPNQIIVSTELGQITNALPFIKKTIGATTDKQLSQEENISYYSCEEKIPSRTTIFQLELTNQTRITKPKDNCYLIEIDNCNKNILSSERFIIEIIKKLGFEKIEWADN